MCQAEISAGDRQAPSEVSPARPVLTLADANTFLPLQPLRASLSFPSSPRWPLVDGALARNHFFLCYVKLHSAKYLLRQPAWAMEILICEGSFCPIERQWPCSFFLTLMSMIWRKHYLFMCLGLGLAQAIFHHRHFVPDRHTQFIVPKAREISLSLYK